MDKLRARKKKWAVQELATNSHLVDNPAELKGRWQNYFGNSNPIYMEIGCGKGRFITQTAALNPDVNFIAMEREKNVIVSGMRASLELDVNIGFILDDVQNITTFFDQGEISRLYINFCDPWPGKKKWRKRRLTHVNFLEMYKKILGSDSGEIFFKTDNRELFEFSLCQFTEAGFRLRDVSLDLHHSDSTGNIMTEYEERFATQNMPIYRCEAYYVNEPSD